MYVWCNTAQNVAHNCCSQRVTPGIVAVNVAEVESDSTSAALHATISESDTWCNFLQ